MTAAQTHIEVMRFTLHGQPWAIRLERVYEVSSRVRIVPLPGIALPILGLVRYRGSLAIAIDLRLRLGIEPRPPQIEDHFILTRGATRPLALVVDRVEGLETVELASLHTLPERAEAEGVLWAPGGLRLLFDLDRALSVEQLLAIDAAEKAAAP